ncbi:unnamed protein product [Hydatigera taeniaeformis]|uniref:FERM domain-containing protein n=1 Tax=Hydatigena taeniaeformis TaxID=6205 RepID=A0A0R3WPE3_HYDTA|nr:unnamed protein product [Hydatigera taeniaeformis]
MARRNEVDETLSNAASPRRRFSSLRRRSLQSSTTPGAISVNGSPVVATPPGTRSASVKFAISADTAQNSTLPKVVYNNTAVYSPIPSVGSGRGADAAHVHFTVEVKLLNDEQEALLIDYTKLVHHVQKIVIFTSLLTCRLFCLNGRIDEGILTYFKAAAFGQWLFDEVISKLGGLLESDYFGLRYLDKNKQRVINTFIRLFATAMARSFKNCLQTTQEQDCYAVVFTFFTDVIPRSLNFRVKHYPAKPLKELKEEKSRYCVST